MTAGIIATESLPAEGSPNGVVVSGNYAYVVNRDSLQVVDISTPSDPQTVGAVGLPDDKWGGAYDLDIVGHYAFVANMGSGLQVVDVSTPSTPVVIATIDTLGNAQDVEVVDGFPCIADGSAGFIVVYPPLEIGTVTITDQTDMSLTLPTPPISGRYTLRVFNDNAFYELPSAVNFTEDLSTLNAKAIIVAGGGPDAPGGIWEETKLCAAKAYDVLIQQGYDHDSIYYLSMETGNSYVDRPSLAVFLSDAIQNWAADASQLLVYFVDHGIEDQFILYADQGYTQTVDVYELDSWLDALQETLPGPVTFIYDACLSGSFLLKMRPPDEKERVVITGASYEPAYFLEGGETSFSYQFWNKQPCKGTRPP